MEKVVICSECHLHYVEGVSEDTELHNRMHVQWLQVCSELGIDRHCSTTYELHKFMCREIFNRHKQDVVYTCEVFTWFMHVQWSYQIYTCIRFDTYDIVKEALRDEQQWCALYSKTYKHEVSEDVYSMFMNKYYTTDRSA